MLSHLIYISNREKECTDQEIDKILASCQENNRHDDITGVLLYSNSKFLQYLEGDYNKINELFDKIKKDPRHSNVVMLTSFAIQERSFPSWEMGAKQMDFENVTFKTDVSAAHKKEFQKILKGETSNKAIPIIKNLFV